MKKLCFIGATAIVVFAGCYKEPKPPQAYDVLTRHKWKIQQHVLAPTDSGAVCAVPTEVEFNKDSTGYFYYYTPCFPGDNPKKTFKWTASYDNHNLYLTDLEGVAGTSFVIGLSYYNDRYLEMHSRDKYNAHYWDGNFEAFEKK